MNRGDVGSRLGGWMLDYFNQILIQICLKEGHHGCLVLVGRRKQKENEFFLADIKICLLLTFIQ